MQCTIGNLYVKYTEAHPDNLFYRCRPRNVKTKAKAKYMGHLCEYCENLQLKIEAINHIKPGTFKDTYELSHNTIILCTKSTGWAHHRPECIARTCDKCRVHLFDVKLAALLDDTSCIVEWKRWEMVVTTCYTNKVAKQVKEKETTTEKWPRSATKRGN